MAEWMEQKANIFYSPNKLVFGLGTASTLAQEVQQLNGKKVLFVTDPVLAQSDLLQQMIASLEAAGIAYATFDRVQPEPPAPLVGDAVEHFHAEGCDLIVGVGGGSSMDVAKGLSIMATNEGSILDVCGQDLVKNRGVPKILMPTTAGTGSETNRVIVVTDERETIKKAVFSLYVLAETAIVDPLLTLTMPPKVTADTGMDALVHAIETFVSMDATPFSDILAERAIQWIADYLPAAWAKGSNAEARYHMSLAATVAGLAFGSGGVGAVHGLANVMGIEYNMSHGLSNAVMLPHVMRYNLSGNPQKYAKLAMLMGKDVDGLSLMEAAGMAVEAVCDLLECLEISYKLLDYGITEADLPKLVEGGMRVSRLFVPNPRDINEEQCRSIYESAL